MTVAQAHPARVVARWNFTTVSVHLFFALVLVWMLVPEIPPTPRANATIMAIGIPLTWLTGISCLLLTDIRFRRRLRESVRKPVDDNVVALRSRRSRERLSGLRDVDRPPAGERS